MRLLLVHEAWHGSWMWHPLVPFLERAGHLVELIDLPGVGDGHSASLRSQGQALARQLKDENARTVVIAHGLAGLVVQRAATQAGGQLAGVLGIDLVTAGPGRSGWSLMTPPGVEAALNGMCIEPSRRALPAPQDFTSALPDQVRLLLAEHLRSQALDTFTEPCNGLDLRATGLLWGGIVSRRPWTGHVRTASLEAGFEIVDSAHELLLTKPGLFAAMIERHLAAQTLRPAAA